MLQIQMRILRVFGLSKAEMNSIIENAQAEGSPSLRLQERDGEYLVCVQASAPTQAMADEYCEKWVQKLRTRFGDACYGFEDTTLAQAALDALKPRGVLAAVLYSGQVIGDSEKQAALGFFRALPLTKYTVLVCEFANWASTSPLPCFVIKK